MSVAVRDLPKPGSGWYVYCHLSAAGDVLYVGCSRTVRNRHYRHRAKAAWWDQVDRVTLLGPWQVQRAALDEEKALIGALDPPYNVLRSSREPAVWTRMVDTYNGRHRSGASA